MNDCHRDAIRKMDTAQRKNRAEHDISPTFATNEPLSNGLCIQFESKCRNDFEDRIEARDPVT